MSADWVLTKTRLRAGIWEGVLSGVGPDAPVLTLRHNADILPGLEVSATDDGAWHVKAAIPADRISDDLQTFTITAADDTTVLAHFVVFAGETIDNELRADLDLLRAELDLLKRAFRKHCNDTK